MKFIREYTYKVINPEPISINAIHAAVYRFKEHCAHKPDTLVMHYSAYYDIEKQLGAEHGHSYDSILGLIPEKDANLNAGEWYVKRSEEIVEALK